MTTKNTLRLRDAVISILDDDYGYLRQADGTYAMEIYADYRDEMSASQAKEIVTSSDPQLALWEKLNEWYFESECYYHGELEKDIRKQLPEELADSDDLSDILMELVYWNYPADHFLNQEFEVNIMLDTGDGNYDFTLNSPYPCWYGRYEDQLEEKSSLLWLARQQGYTKNQLWKALREGDMSDPHGFLESCRVECANLPSSTATMTFLVRMTLEQLIELNRCIQLQDKNGHYYDATCNPYCGYITLDRHTMCGLFDPWDGGGSVLEIELEKDVILPIRFIWSALPDGSKRYDVGDVYGMCSSAWQDTLKEIHAPKRAAG